MYKTIKTHKPKYCILNAYLKICTTLWVFLCPLYGSFNLSSNRGNVYDKCLVDDLYYNSLVPLGSSSSNTGNAYYLDALFRVYVDKEKPPYKGANDYYKELGCPSSKEIESVDKKIADCLLKRLDSPYSYFTWRNILRIGLVARRVLHDNVLNFNDPDEVLRIITQAVDDESRILNLENWHAWECRNHLKKIARYLRPYCVQPCAPKSFKLIEDGSPGWSWVS